MIHVMLLARGAQKSHRQQQAQAGIAQGDAKRQEFFQREREMGKEVI